MGAYPPSIEEMLALVIAWLLPFPVPVRPDLLSQILAYPEPLVPGLDLSTLRQTPSTITSSLEKLPINFMPLCGNGRLDTAQDYTAYYALHGGALSVPAYAIPGSTSVYGTMLVSVEILANEVCDDGNTVDFDGCSADCLHLDLWTSACQLNLDGGLAGLEAVLYTGGPSALLSASGGLYSVALAAEGGSVLTRLLQAKSFPVTDLFGFSGVVILYSAPLQRLWQWDGALTSLAVLPLKAWTSHAFQTRDVVIANDDGEVMVYNLTTRSGATCSLGAGRISSYCVFLGIQGDTLIMGCGTDRITVGLSGSCDFIPQPSPARPSIWVDAFNFAALQSLFTRTVYYNMTLSSSVPIDPPYFTEIYTPLGLWAEALSSSPRMWFPPDNTSPTAVPPMPFLGDSALFLASQAVVCGSGRCVFDMSPYYDLFGTNANLQGSWQEVLQYVVLNLTKGTGVSDFDSLYSNAPLYTSVLERWSEVFIQAVLPRGVLGSMQHPLSGNIWAIRADGLYEITKSGVPVRTGDGQCLPSNVALCPRCQWAPAGSACAPCGVPDPSQAWAVRCGGCKAGRRLLQASAVLIDFVVGGSYTNLTSSLSGVPCVGAASTVWTQVGMGEWGVQVHTVDPVGCMQALNPVLRTMHVVVPPSAPIILPGNPMPQGGLGAGVEVGICVAAVAVVGALAWFLYWSLYYPQQTLARFSAPMHYYPVNSGRWEGQRF